MKRGFLALGFICVLFAGCSDDTTTTDALVETDGGQLDGAIGSDSTTDAKTDAAKGDAAKSDAAKSDAAKGDAAKSDGAKSDGAKSDAAKSDAAKSDAKVSDGAGTDSATGDGALADAGQPAPASANVMVIFATRVDVIWKDSYTNETGYEVDRSIDGTTFTKLATVARTKLYHADKTALPGKTYYYRVRALTSAGPSQYSAALKATTPSEGVLDTSFAAPSGFATYAGAAASDSVSPKSIVIDSKGRTIVVATYFSANKPRPAAWRFLATGALDTSYGTSGRLEFGTPGTDVPTQAVVDHLDRLLVTGWRVTSNKAGMILWRFDAAGKLDLAFGRCTKVAGTQCTNRAGYQVFGDFDGGGLSVAVDSTGAPAVAGWKRISNTDVDLAVWRLKEYGEFDVIFNTTGYATVAGPIADLDRGYAIRIDGKNRLVVYGETHVNGTSKGGRVAIWRFTPGGKLDTAGFNSPKGWVEAGFTSGVSTQLADNRIALDAQNNITLISSFANNGTTWGPTIFRYQEDGKLDTSFNKTGFRIRDVGLLKLSHSGETWTLASPYEGHSMAVDSKGRTLLLLRARLGGSKDVVMVFRFLKDGSADATFNQQGWMVVDPPVNGSSSQSLAVGIALDKSDRIVLTADPYLASYGIVARVK